jgi:hypothetical protein
MLPCCCKTIFSRRCNPGEITDIPAFLKCCSRLKDALTPHVCTLLSMGISAVLDFAANTRKPAGWFRELTDRTHAEHELHFGEASDALCKSRLRQRNVGRPAGSRWTTEAGFDAIHAYFEVPSEEEGFTLIRHNRGECYCASDGKTAASATLLLGGRGPSASSGQAARCSIVLAELCASSISIR